MRRASMEFVTQSLIEDGGLIIAIVAIVLVDVIYLWYTKALILNVQVIKLRNLVSLLLKSATRPAWSP